MISCCSRSSAAARPSPPAPVGCRRDPGSKPPPANSAEAHPSEGATRLLAQPRLTVVAVQVRCRRPPRSRYARCSMCSPRGRAPRSRAGGGQRTCAEVDAEPAVTAATADGRPIVKEVTAVLPRTGRLAWHVSDVEVKAERRHRPDQQRNVLVTAGVCVPSPLRRPRSSPAGSSSGLPGTIR